MYNTIASICSDLLTQLWSVESAENSPHMIFIRPSAAQGSPVLWRFWAASPGTTLNIQARYSYLWRGTELHSGLLQTQIHLRPRTWLQSLWIAYWGLQQWSPYKLIIYKFYRLVSYSLTAVNVGPTTPWTLRYFLKQLPSVQFCSLEGQPQWEEFLDLPQNNPEWHNDKWGLSSLLCYRITILLDIPQTTITITLHLLYSYFHRLFTTHATPILTMNR